MLASLAIACLASSLAPAWQDRFAPQVDPGLQLSINDAIDRGVAYLLKRQNRDGSWTGEIPLWEIIHDPDGQTPLALYALLKSKVPKDHAAIQRGLAYLQVELPTHTYHLAIQLMLYEALADPRARPRMEKLLERLLANRMDANTGWDYPGAGRGDLSNTQYAGLGLRAAHQAGLKLPRDCASDLLTTTLSYREKPRKVAVKVAAGETTTGEHEEAGFGYVPGDAAKGSMTAGGLTLLACARDLFGKGLTDRDARTIDVALRGGLRWLEERWTVAENPSGDRLWQYYYLYGLERVAGLFELARIGGHDWYSEGARFLVSHQNGDGSWPALAWPAWGVDGLGNQNTSLALLFLVKATGAVVTGSAEKKSSHSHFAEDPRHDVWIRAAGTARVRMLVSGFSDAIRKALHDEALKGMRVLDVQWIVDDQVVATEPGPAEGPWRDERFAIEHRFERNGEHTIFARARAVVPGVAAGAEGSIELLESGLIVVQVLDVLESGALEESAARSRNLLDGAEAQVSASSVFDDIRTARGALDGRQYSAWVCKGEDAQPTLTIVLDKPVRANVLWLSQPDSNLVVAKRFARTTRVEIRLNDQKPISAEVDPDWRRRTRIELEKPLVVRRIVIAIVGRESGVEQGLAAGLAEVELELAR